MKIYTKKGDSGLTSLLGKTGVLKNSLAVEAYGTVDELNCYVGLVLDHLPYRDTNVKTLLQVQNDLFVIGSNLAKDPDSTKIKVPILDSSAITHLESQIDQMQADLEPLRNFILPGGHPTLSYAHLARAVCRRAERQVVRLAQEQATDALFIAYLNRLSDYFFVLARFIASQLGLGERLWQTTTYKT